VAEPVSQENSERRGLSVNHSILWALFHAFLSWFYVIYHWIVHGKLLP
jgi:hypothetical protein